MVSLEKFNPVGQDMLSMNVCRTGTQYPISDAQLAELQSEIRNRGAGREIHDKILAALGGDTNARAYCAGVWDTLHKGA